MEQLYYPALAGTILKIHKGVTIYISTGFELALGTQTDTKFGKKFGKTGDTAAFFQHGILAKAQHLTLNGESDYYFSRADLQAGLIKATSLIDRYAALQHYTELEAA